ncbi:MAG: excinuclease ABC subunit UvrA [Eubacteriaceae bacterium]|nr:excinuclease ABC subunit UvrA [Eubacteriaceae bacterium]
MDYIEIKGAKENNLKNINLRIPRNAFIVFTGLSGSGKTSLAFDTIYAEGQRRYVESLSSYARQFLGQTNKPDVESIEGLSPAISIDQRTTSHNPRSTVGTVTEIYDYLRLLYARIGIPHCPECGKEIASQSIDQMIDAIMGRPDGERLEILAPIVRGEKGTHKKLWESLGSQGFVRAYVDGALVGLDEDISLNKNTKHDISIVVDRIKIAQGIRSRLAESLETALKAADGLAIAKFGETEELYSENYACPECNISFGKIEPRDFSFNSPFGMCPKCSGLGYEQEIDESLVLPDKSLSISEGGIRFFGNDSEGYYFSIIKELAKSYGFSIDAPLSEASPEFMHALMHGDERVLSIRFNSYFSGNQERTLVFEGLLNNMARRYRDTGSQGMREKIEEYMSIAPCSMCHGKKLNSKSLAVSIADRNIIEITEMPISDALAFFQGIKLSERDAQVGRLAIKEIMSRLGFLSDVGLNYLTLARSAASLSGGESQRIRLATQIGSQLTGVLYVLDEPSIGLHQRDNAKLIATLRRLTGLGNTLIVVEHDEETMLACDYIVDIGPGAGESGGNVVFSGTHDEIVLCDESITGQYLSGKKSIKTPKERTQPKGWLTVNGASANNLKGISASFPIGAITAVTGVSGSGKSSLVNEVLYKAAAKKLNRAYTVPGPYESIEGLEFFEKAIAIDQSPIGRTPRSNPATYTGTFDHIRDLFASTSEAKIRGYKKGRFSFNTKGGRCEACTGDGIIKIEMHFLPDVYVPCEVCKGKRYNAETLLVTYKGKNISDVLDMPVEEALSFFGNVPKIKDKIQTLYDVGLGYIKLGQPSTTISGGEAQRVKLATELSRRSNGRSLYILDEPTTGLHNDDIAKLLSVLFRLRDMGNTIVVIEHNMDVIKCADYIIDLGPEGGNGGGEIIAVGTPEEIAMLESSATGSFLKKTLQKGNAPPVSRYRAPAPAKPCV